MMKKFTLMAICLLVIMSMSAQTYTVISRSNDTIKMYPNALGAAASSLKSIIPGSKAETPQYRLIKKVYQGKESLIFVDFTKILDKILVAYETDMATPGEWQTTTISYEDLYNEVVRENAIYLRGKILGMQVEMFQRPSPYEDMVNIDGIEFPLPLKLAVYESELAKKIEKAKEKALEQENKRLEQEAKNQEKDALLRELSQKDENKAFIALIIKSQQYKKSYASEISKYFQNEEIQKLIQNYTIEQLEEKSQNHNKYFNKYVTY